MEAKIRRVARERLNEGLVTIFLRQAWAEAALAWRRIHFRRRRNAEALRAYCAMTADEFSAVNARQQWANWRTIPRSLHGRLPEAPCRAVDLCSGVGHSTEVLAYYLPPGSEILGLEYNPEFVRAAAGRTYRGALGERVPVSFRAQTILETFRDAGGEPVPDGSVDVVNSCGSLGIHFEPPEIDGLVGEIARVLKPGGLATVDARTRGGDQAEMVGLFRKRGFEAVGRARSCCFDRFTHICFRTGRPPAAQTPVN